MEREASHDDAV